MPHEHNPTIPENAVFYYTNCRGVNYLPQLEYEWKKSGYVPRYPQNICSLLGMAEAGHENDNTFLGTNKTSQWYYYDPRDHERCLSQLNSVGINSIRVFLDIYVWQHQPETFLSNLDNFLSLCDKHKVRCQLCLWDGINIFNIGYNLLNPITTREHTVSAYQYGLRQEWRPNPEFFEVSSQAQADDFFTTCATPYLDALMPVVSGHQSMWSFDVLNEYNPNASLVSSIASATIEYMRPSLSSVGITFTFGHGTGYVVQEARAGEPDLIFMLSSVLDFASLHTYGNSRYLQKKYVNEAASAVLDTSVPAMYNENTHLDDLARPSVQLYYFNESGFGGIMFDGFADRPGSNEPFLSPQGMIHSDGTWRHKTDGLAYRDVALSSGWYPASQLAKDFEIKEKETTSNSGLDGGYWSGTPTVVTAGVTDYTLNLPLEQLEWSPEFSAVTESKYDYNRAFHYDIVRGLLASWSRSPYVAANYTPLPGHPYALGVGMSRAYTNLNPSDLVPRIYEASAFYPSLTTYSDPIERNRSLWERFDDLDKVIFTLFENSTNNALRNNLLGKSYDYSPVASSLRLEISGLFYEYSRNDGSSIDPVVNDNYVTSINTPNDLPCHATQSCFYIDDNPANDIDWAAYDTYLDNMRAKLIEGLDALALAAESNPDYRAF